MNNVGFGFLRRAEDASLGLRDLLKRVECASFRLPRGKD